MWIAIAAAQTPKSVVGTVSAFKPETLEMEVKPDAGDAVAVTFNSETVVQRVAPGEKDLKNAKPIQITDVAMGDKVLVSFLPGTRQARRIVVMSASEIAKRNEADTQDWMKRGVAGIVAGKTANTVTLKTRSFQGETQVVVAIGEKTKFRRYAPDSVRFLDAKASGLAEVNTGDQLRARGQKSEDGLKVDADEVVFGTFLTRAGTITAVDADAKEIKVKDLVTNKPLTIRLTADSQLKALPDFAAMMAARGGQGGGAPGGGPPGGMGMGAGRPAFDMAQMIERMPPTKIENLKVGDTVVVSSTKGAAADQVTAITVLANANLLIQMASGGANRGGGQRGGMGMGGGMGMPGMGGLSGGLEGLGMPGMIP